MVSKEQKINWQKICWKTIKIRDSIFKPLLQILTIAGVKSNAVTYCGTILMIFFILFIKRDLLLSLIFLLSALFLDLVDGPLARFQKRDSDKGKFIDNFNDMLVFAIFIFGLVYVNLLNELVALVLIFAFIFSNIFRIIHVAHHFKSKCIFKTIVGSGFFPALLRALLYFHFSLYALFGVGNIILVSLVISVLLLGDMLIFYIRIITK